MAKKKIIPDQEFGLTTKPQGGSTAAKLPTIVFDPYDSKSYTEAYKKSAFRK